MKIKNYPKKPDAVYFYSTCLVNLLSPKIGLSAVKLLKRESIKVIYPKNQTCCSQPAFNSGYWKEAKSVIKKQIKLFYKDYPIIVPSSSCASMLKNHAIKLFENDPFLPIVENVASRVYEFTEFLVHSLKINLEDLGPPIKAVWHTSCQASRAMNIVDEPKALLRQLKNVELIEIEREKECCGFGGTFSIKHPEISAVIVHDKVIDAVKSSADILLASECGCLLNIDGSIKKMEIILPTEHIANFLWERTNAKKD